MATVLTPQQQAAYYASEGQKATPLSPDAWLAQQQAGNLSGTGQASPGAATTASPAASGAAPTSSGNPLIDFSNALNTAVNMAAQKRQALGLSIAMPFQGTAPASDFNSIFANLKTAGDTTANNLITTATKAYEASQPTYKTITDASGATYQVQEDPTGKVIGTPQLLFPPNAIDQEYKAAQLANIRANTEKTLNDIAQTQGAGAVQQLTPYLDTSASGIPYVDVSALSAADKNKIAQIAGNSGIKVITNANAAQDISNIKNAYANLDTISNIMGNLTSPSPTARVLNALPFGIARLAETDPQKAAAGALNDSALDLLKAISGVQGFRGNQGAIDQIRENMPNIFDTKATAQAKIANVRQLIQNRENALLGAPSSDTSSSSAPPAGTLVTAPDGTQVIITD